MRGEVQLLTRNIRVEGKKMPVKDDGWGGHVTTTTYVNPDTNKINYGRLDWDNVQVYNCSQRNTWNAAVRFAKTGASVSSSISNSAIHQGFGWALYIAESKNVAVSTTAMVGFRAVGANVHASESVTLDGNFVGDVTERDEFGKADMAVDKRACYAICSYNEPDRCRSISIVNNIAAGCVFAGFVAPGVACDDIST